MRLIGGSRWSLGSSERIRSLGSVAGMVELCAAVSIDRIRLSSAKSVRWNGVSFVSM